MVFRHLIAIAALLLLNATTTYADDAPLRPILDFLKSKPGDIALQALEVSPDGEQTRLFGHNQSQPMPLASSMKIVILDAYARAVAAGTLDPMEKVRVSDWEGYYLPGTDGGAHPESLKALGIAADEDGRAKDGARSVDLDTIARFMIETSDNTSTDYLLARLGKDAIRGAIESEGLTGQTPIVPLSGLYVSWFTDGEAYLKMTSAGRLAYTWTLAERVQADPLIRKPFAIPENPGPEEIARFIALAHETPPMGTPQDYAALMGRVLSGEGFEEKALDVMRRHLGWPLRGQPEGSNPLLKTLYAKGGSFDAGVLTQNCSFELRDGRRFSYSLFFRHIAAEDYEKIRQAMDVFIFMTIRDDNARKELLKSIGQH